MLSPGEAKAIEANLFPLARWIVTERPDFPWHRDRSKRATASMPNSSQALALDVFCTIDRLNSREAILEYIVHRLGITGRGPWHITPEEPLPHKLLGEPKPSQLDIVICGSSQLLVAECKFTEPGGGECSQPHPLAKGSHRGKRQCNGNYELQTNPVNNVTARCALTAKGVKYWSTLSGVLAVDADVDHRPCPFSDGRYQWMRNILAAAALGYRMGLPATFVLVYADGPFPIPKYLQGSEWAGFTRLATGEVPIRTASFQQLLTWAGEAAAPSDRMHVEACHAWLRRKVVAVATLPFRGV
jgi:restriction endonuclease-like protein